MGSLLWLFMSKSLVVSIKGKVLRLFLFVCFPRNSHNKNKIEMYFWETIELNPKTSLKMLTITLPRGIEGGLTEIVHKEMRDCVEVLGPKFGFAAPQALEGLLMSNIKFVKKRGPIPKVGKGDKPIKAKSASEVKGASGYLLFSSVNRDDVRSELECGVESGKKLLPQQVVKELAVRWKALEQEERDEWNYSAKEIDPPPVVRQNAQDNFTLDNPPPLLQATRQPHDDPRFPEESDDDLLENEPKPACVPEPIKVSDSESDDDDDDGAVEVVKFEIDGTVYLKDDNNKLYDKESWEEVGEWVVHSDRPSHAEFYMG